MNIDKIEILVFEIERLLLNFNQSAWANQLRRARITYNADKLVGKTEILGLFGGLGSLTDLVLYKNGTPLIDENNKLHDMLEQLYLELH